MPITKVKSEFEKLSEIVNSNIIADECTASELKLVHDEFQAAILSGDPSQALRNKKLIEQLLALEESHPLLGKVIKDLMAALSGMGI